MSFTCRRSSLRLVASFAWGVGVLVLCPFEAAAVQPRVDWIKQIGPAASGESGLHIATDDFGNAYVTGYTQGDVGGPAFGDFDAFLMKLSPAGEEVWARHWGTSGQEFGRSITVDTRGSVYSVGGTTGDLDITSLGSRDAVVRRYDLDGQLIWSKQFGTSSTDEAMGVYADGLGGIYVAGITAGDFETMNVGGLDAFLCKLDEAGNVLWKRQYGTDVADSGLSVSGDALGNIFVAGATQGSLGGPRAGTTTREPLPYDAYLTRFDAAGNQSWIRQFGDIADDSAGDVATDGLGNVYVAGITRGDLEPGMNFTSGGFLAKYDSAGNRLWLRQQALGGGLVGSTGVAVDSEGRAYISAYTSISLFDEMNAGQRDNHLRQYDSDGNLIWAKLWGTTQDDIAEDVAVDRFGTAYVAGSTYGNFPGHTGSTSNDATVTRVVGVPESSACVLLTIAVSLMGIQRSRRCLLIRVGV